MALHCRVCGASYDPGIAVMTGFTHCPKCGALGRPPAVMGERTRPRAEVACPPAITVSEGGGRRWTLVHRWGAKRDLYWWVPVGFFGGLFLLFWFLPRDRRESDDDRPWFLLVVAAGFALVGLVRLVNRTRISSDGEMLRVSHGPVPWWPQHRLRVSNVAQVFSVKRYFSEMQTQGDHFDSNLRYRLMVRRHAGSDVLLVDSIPSADRVLFLEQEIERRLGIVDRRVQGELPRV